MSFWVPFEELDLVADAREFLLDFQVSRRVNGALENTPLLGAPGACASSSQYARVLVTGT